MFNDPSSFEVSAANIVPGCRRRSLEEVPSFQNNPSDPISSKTVAEPSAAMDPKDQIVHILGDLAGYKEQLQDCIETDVSNVTSIEELEDLKKEAKLLKADIQKAVSKLEYIDKSSETGDYKTLVDNAKKLITSIDSRKNNIHTKKCKNQQEEVFSRVRILASSVDLAFNRCKNKFTIKLNTIEDGQLIMLSDNITALEMNSMI